MDACSLAACRMGAPASAGTLRAGQRETPCYFALTGAASPVTVQRPDGTGCSVHRFGCTGVHQARNWSIDIRRQKRPLASGVSEWPSPSLAVPEVAVALARRALQGAEEVRIMCVLPRALHGSPSRASVSGSTRRELATEAPPWSGA